MPNNAFALMVRCESCQHTLDSDRVDEFQEHSICDDCADKLQPERYNAAQFEIAAEAEKVCVAKTGLTMAAYGVAVVEDDMGDVVSFTERCAELFIASAVAGQSMSDLLPEEARLTHRKFHRQAIKDSVTEQHPFVVNGQHWAAELHPFREQGEVFTLTLFSKTRA